MQVRLAAAVAFGLFALAPARTRAEKLTFAWPVPAVVKVTEVATKQGDGAAPTTVRMRYDVAVTKAADGERLQVVLKNFEFLEVNGMDARKPALRAQLGATLKAAGAMPTLLINPDGSFDDVTGTDRVAEQIAAAAPPKERAGVRKLVGSPPFAAILKGTAAELWNAWVGLWVGRDLAVGRTVTVDKSLGRAGQSLDRPVKLTNQGMAGPPGHVHLAFTSALEGTDDKLLQTMVDGLLAQIAQATGKAVPREAIEDAVLSSQGEVITDPATLRPVNARWQKNTALRLKDDKGTFARHESHEYTFAWGPSKR
jgi:hypothetical protein